MPLRKITFALFGLCALPVAAPAGEIDFTIGGTKLTGSSSDPIANALLLPIYPSTNGYSFDTATGEPVHIPVVTNYPYVIPTPPASGLDANGHTHWNVDVPFTVTLTLANQQTGDSVDFQLSGLAHLHNQYSAQFPSGWTGTADYWFQSYDRVTLDGQTYTIWGSDTCSPATTAGWPR